VTDRVMVRKSWKRTLMLIVRPAISGPTPDELASPRP